MNPFELDDFLFNQGRGAYGEMIEQDQQIEDEELKELDEKFKREVDDGEATSDFLRGN